MAQQDNDEKGLMGWTWTLRDDFAKAAMQGILAKSNEEPYETVALWAYKYADAMLKERGK